MFVYINNIKWNIIFTNNVEYLKRNDGSITLGITDNNIKTIFIFNKLNSALTKKVLIHELTHAYIFSYNYYLTLEEEEFVCSFVENYGGPILHDIDTILNTGVKMLPL